MIPILGHYKERRDKVYLQAINDILCILSILSILFKAGKTLLVWENRIESPTIQ